VQGIVRRQGHPRRIAKPHPFRRLLWCSASADPGSQEPSQSRRPAWRGRMFRRQAGPVAGPHRATPFRHRPPRRLQATAVRRGRRRGARDGRDRCRRQRKPLTEVWPAGNWLESAVTVSAAVVSPPTVSVDTVGAMPGRAVPQS
jgi:hypothetical protein